MKRILVVFVVAIATGTTIAATVQHFMPKDGTRIGQRSATFDVDGVNYIITDRATLDEIDRVVESQTELGRQQAELGAEQARIGAQQRHAKNDAERHALEEQQYKLAGKQLELAEQERRAAETVDKELEKIFRNAVRTGVARKR